MTPGVCGPVILLWDARNSPMVTNSPKTEKVGTAMHAQLEAFRCKRPAGKQSPTMSENPSMHQHLHDQLDLLMEAGGPVTYLRTGRIIGTSGGHKDSDLRVHGDFEVRG